MPIKRRTLFRWLAALIVLLGTTGYVALDRWQRATIFSVELGEARWAREAPAATEIYDLPVSGKETIRAWYIAAANPNAPTVLYLHGSRWNLNSSVFRIERWLEMGYSMLAIDYRGFGESSPRLPSQASAAHDATVALRELQRRQPDPAKRFVYGHSLGGAIAVNAVTSRNVPDFAGLILESTFTNIQDMIATSRWAHIPGLRWLVTQPFNSLGSVAHVKAPVLVMHGTGDRVIPHTMSDQIYQAAARHPANRLVKFEHASHSGASRDHRYDDVVTAFVEQAMAARRHDRQPG
jgi:alpha-beta hydrolase superfamily lysophospholipase